MAVWPHDGAGGKAIFSDPMQLLGEVRAPCRLSPAAPAPPKTLIASLGLHEQAEEGQLTGPPAQKEVEPTAPSMSRVRWGLPLEGKKSLGALPPGPRCLQLHMGLRGSPTHPGGAPRAW